MEFLLQPGVYRTGDASTLLMITKCALCQPKIKNTHSFQLMQHHISETMGNDLDI